MKCPATQENKLVYPPPPTNKKEKDNSKHYIIKENFLLLLQQERKCNNELKKITIVVLYAQHNSIYPCLKVQPSQQHVLELQTVVFLQN